MKKKKWSEEEIKFLRSKSSDMYCDDLAQALSVSSSQIKYQCNRLGISTKKLRRRWTEEDKQLVYSMSPRQAAERLGVKLSTARAYKYRSSLRGTREIATPTSSYIEDFQVERIQSLCCDRCQRESQEKRCKIFSTAYVRNIHPQEWNLEDNTCTQFIRK